MFRALTVSALIGLLGAPTTHAHTSAPSPAPSSVPGAGHSPAFTGKGIAARASLSEARHSAAQVLDPARGGSLRLTGASPDRSAMAPSASTTPGESIYDVLAREVELGRLSELDALRHTLEAVRSPGRLPFAYAGYARPPLRCLTGLFRDARAALPRYSAAYRAEVEALLALPDPGTFAGYIDSSLYPVRVHYQLETDYDKALEGLGYLERAYEVEVIETGFRPPLPDGEYGGSPSFDMFFMHGLGGCSTVSAGDEVAGEYRMQFPAATYYDVDAYGTPELFDVTVAHEFNHGIQAGYDWFETLIALEMTATFFEDVVFDDRNDYYNYLSAFQNLPQKPIDYRGYTFSYYSYASNLYLHFIREAYAGGDAAFAVDMWEQSQDKSKVSNEPDYLDALELILPAWGGNGVVQAARDFAEWRWFIGQNDDGVHLEEATDMGTRNQPAIAAIYLPLELPAISAPAQIEKPGPLGANYIEIDELEPVQSRTLELQLKGDVSTTWGLDVLGYPSEGGPAIITHLEVMGSEGGGRVPLTGLKRAVIVVTNLSNGGHDPEQHDYVGRAYSLEMRLSND